MIYQVLCELSLDYSHLVKRHNSKELSRVPATHMLLDLAGGPASQPLACMQTVSQSPHAPQLESLLSGPAPQGLLHLAFHSILYLNLSKMKDIVSQTHISPLS